MAPSQIRNRRKVTWIRIAVPPSDPIRSDQRIGKAFLVRSLFIRI